jgi:hypothetical protein
MSVEQVSALVAADPTVAATESGRLVNSCLGGGDFNATFDGHDHDHDVVGVATTVDVDHPDPPPSEYASLHSRPGAPNKLFLDFDGCT